MALWDYLMSIATVNMKVKYSYVSREVDTGSMFTLDRIWRRTEEAGGGCIYRVRKVGNK